MLGGEHQDACGRGTGAAMIEKCCLVLTLLVFCVDANAVVAENRIDVYYNENFI